MPLPHWHFIAIGVNRTDCASKRVASPERASAAASLGQAEALLASCSRTLATGRRDTFFGLCHHRAQARCGHHFTFKAVPCIAMETLGPTCTPHYLPLVCFALLHSFTLHHLLMKTSSGVLESNYHGLRRIAILFSWEGYIRSPRFWEAT